MNLYDLLIADKAHNPLIRKVITDNINGCVIKKVFLPDIIRCIIQGPSESRTMYAIKLTRDYGMDGYGSKPKVRLNDSKDNITIIDVYVNGVEPMNKAKDN